MIKNKYPTIKPSLNLDFENTKSLDPRVTFRRGTPGTYYDGMTHAKAEENLFRYSQKFDEYGTTIGRWDRRNTDIMTDNTDEFLAPDGTQTAWKFSDSDTSSDNHSIFQHVYTTDSSAEIVTFSIFAKAGDANRFLQLITGFDDVDNNTHPCANFDLFTGTITRDENTLNTSITDAGNGWYRCSITFVTTIVSGLTINPVIYLIDDPLATRDQYYSGDGSSGLYIWGAQLEQRDTVTSYTKTADAPVTRYQPKLMTAAADRARFDHDPITGESKGLLIEEQRANLHRRSEDFSTTDHINFSGDMFANQTIAPDGQPTATSVVMDDGKTSGGWSTMARPAATAGVEYTFSIHIKPGDFSKFEFGLNPRLNTQGDNGASTFVYNFDTHTVEQTLTYGDAPEPTSHTVQSIGNGWYRATISAVMPANTAYLNTFAYIKDTVAGAGNNTFYVWGSQLEQGGFATSYIRTTGAQATRSADDASIVGENFSSWYRQDQGSIVASASIDMNKRKGGTGMPVYNILRDTTALFGLSRDWQYWYHGIVNNSESTYKYSSDSESATGALTYDFSDGYLHSYVDQFENLSSTTWTWREAPFVHEHANTLRLGTTIAGNSGSNNLNGHIKKLTYYPQRLTNEQLQNLTR